MLLISALAGLTGAIPEVLEGAPVEEVAKTEVTGAALDAVSPLFAASPADELVTFARMAKGYGDEAASPALGMAMEPVLVGGGCFAAGTVVHAEAGLKAIEEVKAGERVWAWDELRGEVVLRRVTRTFVREAQELVALEVEDADGEVERLRATEEHPFWTKRGWVGAKDLRETDEIRRISGDWARVRGVEAGGEREWVYNFEVEEVHNYFVGEQGLLAHNTSRVAIAGAAKGTGPAAAPTIKGLGNIGSHGTPIDPSTALNSGTKWLGPGYKEVAPGVYRSADGLRQFRKTNADLTPTHGNIGSHVHFEALNKSGTVVQNLHLPVGR